MHGDYYINHLVVLVTFCGFGLESEKLNWLYWNQLQLLLLHIEWIHYWIFTATGFSYLWAMSCNDRRGSSTPKKKIDLDWGATNNPDCVAEDGWEDEPSPWNCATCKRFVKMKHLHKLCDYCTNVAKQAPSGEIKAENSKSNCPLLHWSNRGAPQIQNIGIQAHAISLNVGW